ncbi:hypothetical protein BH23VER1_BH23VER1_03440 [soil metagenome]
MYKRESQQVADAAMEVLNKIEQMMNCLKVTALTSPEMHPELQIPQA